MVAPWELKFELLKKCFFYKIIGRTTNKFSVVCRLKYLYSFDVFRPICVLLHFSLQQQVIKYKST